MQTSSFFLYHRLHRILLTGLTISSKSMTHRLAGAGNQDLRTQGGTVFSGLLLFYNSLISFFDIAANLQP